MHPELVSPATRMANRARGLLPGMTASLLIAAWWLSLIVIWQTPLVDLTPPKMLAIAALPLLIIARIWTLVARTDRSIILLVYAYVVWLVLTAVLRGSGYDVKMTGGYAVFFGGAFALAYSAARARPDRAAVALTLAALGGLAITLIGVGLERFAYPGSGASDSLAPLWGLVRPQDGTFHPGLGPQPLHFPSGDPTVLRVSSWFAQTNYLAFFAVLVAGLTATLLVAMLHRGRLRAAALAALGLAACAVTVVWTYSRAGMIGLIAVVAAVVVTDVVRDAKAWRSRSMMLLRGAPIVLVLAVLSASLLTDDVGLRRFTPLVANATPAPGDQVPSIELSAARAGAIRIATQAAAFDLVTEDPRTLLLGPGQETFDMAIHDPASPHFVKDAIGIIDPNSLWLSLGISGGIVAAVLLASVLALTWIRVSIASRRIPAGSRLSLVLWLAAWIPTWALLQFAGTFPFNPSEAIILGTLLGAAIAQSGVGRQQRPIQGTGSSG